VKNGSDRARVPQKAGIEGVDPLDRDLFVQAWLWFVAMAVFSHAQHNLGLAGAPRRTMLSAAPTRLSVIGHTWA